MLRIRLQPTGKKKQHAFRIVVQDQGESRDGPVVEILGTYDPKIHPPVKNLKLERVEYWLEKGAQLSDTTKTLVERYKKKRWDDLLNRKKVSKHKKEKPSKKEKEVETQKSKDQTSTS